MASLVKSPHSKFWIAAFRDASGRQHRRTTREVNKVRAKAVADQYERVAQRKGDPHRVRETFASFYREHYNLDLPNASVKDYAARWLAGHKAELGEATFDRYERVFGKLLAFLGAQAERDLTEVTKA